ncbi:MAG: 50S ribosomal protein L4 [Planctomycetota bacterium]|nr:50S ribosomal protein L4 [Planctomycetota bacterium]
MELSIFNEQGQEVGKVQFDEKLLGEKVRRKLMHQAVVRYEANRRQGTHSTTSKAERAGTGKKPWKQKHTGRARAGMRRSPLWRKGGVAFGPRPRDHRQEMPVRMRREALKSAILSKLLDQQLKVIDLPEYNEPKAKRIATTLKKLGLDRQSCLLATHKADANLIKSVRNLPRALLLPARNLNAYEVLKHRNLLLTKDTVEHLGEIVKA